MAEILKYINTDSSAGGDGTTNNTTGADRAYASANEWEANEQQVLSGDTARGLASAPSSVEDTTTVDINGWTVSPTEFVTLESSDGIYTLNVAGSDALNISERYVRIINLNVKVNGAFTAIDVGFGSTAAGDVQISRCKIWNGSTGNDCKGIKAFRTDFRIWNNVIYDFRNDGGAVGVGIESFAGSATFDHYIYHNTLHNIDRGIWREYADITYLHAKGNVVQNCDESYHSFSPNAVNSDSLWNITDINPTTTEVQFTVTESGNTTGIAANKLIDSGASFESTVKLGQVLLNNTDQTWTYVTAIDNNTTVTLNADIFASGENYFFYGQVFGNVVFENEGSDDFHLDESDTIARGKAEDLSADSFIPFDDDKDGVTRSAWDAGAFEFVTSSGVIAILRRRILGYS